MASKPSVLPLPSHAGTDHMRLHVLDGNAARHRRLFAHPEVADVQDLVGGEM